EMPEGFSWRQGFSFDIFIEPDGTHKIIEINTNRGRAKFWSDFLRDPEILGAHVRLIQELFGWQYKGASGEILAKNLGNLVNHILSDLIYFDDLTKKGDFDSEFILYNINERNVFLLNELEPYFESAEESSKNYVSDMKEFASGYRLHQRNVKSIGDRAWTQLCSWARSFEGYS
ncbi:MAG: hypothetical protein AAF203_00135, partial [Pseudomonadota bacterium]